MNFIKRNKSEQSWQCQDSFMRFENKRHEIDTTLVQGVHIA